MSSFYAGKRVSAASSLATPHDRLASFIDCSYLNRNPEEPPSSVGSMRRRGLSSDPVPQTMHREALPDFVFDATHMR